MLRRFSVRNHRCFKDTIILDLVPAGDYGFCKECVNDGTIAHALVYGGNGCGKTGLGIALMDIRDTICRDPIDHELPSESRGMPEEDDTVFGYEFLTPQGIVSYGYSKDVCGRVTSEHAELDGIRIFRMDRRRRTYECPHIENPERFLFGRGASVRLLAPLLPDDVRTALESMRDFVYGMGMIRPESTRACLGSASRHVPADYKTSEQEQACRKSMEWIPGERPEEREEKAKALGARPEDMNWNAYFPGAIMAHTLDSPGWTTFLYIDCIDSYLDFRAAEMAVKGLHASGIQTVLTTRHLELFTTRLFRPDCCFVMEKGNVDCLPRLTDMELREGHNLGRLLRGGEFTRLDG